MFDVIPDIHGQADKLKGALGNLGYQERNGAWRHSDPTRHVVFLGDFIDRGPENCQRQSKSEPKGSAKCCHFGVREIAA